MTQVRQTFKFFWRVMRRLKHWGINVCICTYICMYMYIHMCIFMYIYVYSYYKIFKFFWTVMRWLNLLGILVLYYIYVYICIYICDVLYAHMGNEKEIYICIQNIPDFQVLLKSNEATQSLKYTCSILYICIYTYMWCAICTCGKW
jgi:hypothetical protein